jgi:hypothetical protein
MAERIKLSIRARGAVDSPTVEDLLDQIRDFFAILKGVEEAIAEDGTNAIEWRIVRASTNSPIEFEGQAFPVNFAVNVDRRAGLVVRYTAAGMQQLRTRGDRPAYFTDKVVRRAEQVFQRVTNGLDRTLVDFGNELPNLELTPPIAREAVKNAVAVLKPPENTYSEVGSIEGTARSIDRDRSGRLVLWVHHRLTGEDVKCFVSGQAEQELGEHKIRDVWRGKRVQVYGVLRFKGLGKLDRADGTMLRFLRDREDLPGVDDILDTEFTGGLRSEDYIARLRDGDFN